jgi:hypothetical protein
MFETLEAYTAFAARLVPRSPRPLPEFWTASISVIDVSYVVNCSVSQLRINESPVRCESRSGVAGLSSINK